MSVQFEITSFLREAFESSQNGRAHIVGKGTEWCLDIADGQVLFAAHSLQYLTALETALPSLGYEAALPVYWRLTQYLYKRQIGERGLEALNWTSKVVGALVQHNTLNLKQAEATLAKLIEDAVESLLGLESATITWHPLPQGMWHLTTSGIQVSTLVSYLSKRLDSWQLMADRICSPHQRPYCETPEDIYKPVPQGQLSQQMLQALVRLMQGSSIRQLAQAIKQDEVKLAKLLYPYIEHRVIKLWPPIQPLDRLPWLPAAQVASAVPTTAAVNSNNQLTKSTATSVNGNNQLTKSTRSNRPVANGGSAVSTPNKRPIKKTSRSRHLIVCIDDSQAMLEKVDSYLDPEHFELKTIIDPVASVSKICAMKPDLVLMDVSMPSINGNSLCEILKRSYMFKDVPIIMISSNASPLNKATAQSSGATDYLEKPFSKAQLINVLETYLEINLEKVG